MSDANEKSEGGLHVGKVGGGVNVNAGRDVVFRDKTTTTTTTITIQRGFAGDEQKQQFQAEIDQLREALQAMKTQIEASTSIDRDKKNQVISDIQQQVNALKQVKEETAEVPTGKPAPPEIATKVEGALDRAGGIVDKLQGLATKTADIGETVGKLAVKYGPLISLISNARHLFGLP